jgi:hypothetical protein
MAKRRRAATAVILLGAGAGLDGRWIRHVRGTAVERLEGVVVVAVGPPAPRAVPVLRPYERDLVGLAALAGDEYLVGGHATHRNRLHKIRSAFERGHDGLELSPGRLRSTWLVHHLSSGARLPELLAAAGTSRVESLDALLEYVRPMDGACARALLRGASG